MSVWGSMWTVKPGVRLLGSEGGCQVMAENWSLG